LKTTEIESAK